MDYWLIGNEVIPLESAMVDVTHIDIAIRSCHDVQLAMVRNIVLSPSTVRSYIITIFCGCFDGISGYTVNG